jgi:hypothetical protein
MQAAVSSVGEDQNILVFGSFLTVSTAAGWVQDSLLRDRHKTAKINRSEPGTDLTEESDG